MATQAFPYVSPEEYLTLDRAAEQRSEYVDGQICAMAGGTRRHARIIGNVTNALAGQMIGGCEAVSSDMRLRVSETGAFFYPDVLVTCGPISEVEDSKDTVDEPKVLIEVTSKSSAIYDRAVKFRHYRTIRSLDDYLVIDQFRILIEHFARQPDGGWLFHEYRSADEVIDLLSIGAKLSLADVYRRVEFRAES